MYLIAIPLFYVDIICLVCTEKNGDYESLLAVVIVFAVIAIIAIIAGVILLILHIRLRTTYKRSWCFGVPRIYF